MRAMMKREQQVKDKYLPLRDEAQALIHPDVADRDDDEESTS